MIYVACYLLVGLLLVTIKSPIRKLVDTEITRIGLHDAFAEEKTPVFKVFLLRIILSAVLVLIYPVMLFSEYKERKARRKKYPGEISTGPESHKAWLKNKISLEEAEAKHTVEIGGENIPFGYMHFRWIAILSKMQEGDELHEFISSDESWEYLAGREGIALVRNGEIVADIVTTMN